MEKIKNGLHKRKVKIFLVFLASSFLAWFVSRLSETYTDNTSFDLVYTNVPDSLILTNTSKDKVDVRLRASGFQFLGFNFSNKEIKIDLSSVDQNPSNYFVPHEVYRKQIEKQLSGSMTLLEVDKDTLFFNFFKVYAKEIPIQPNIIVNLAQNYLLAGELKVEPGTVTIKGPKTEIANIDYVGTLKMVLTDVTDNFENRAVLHKPEELKNTTFSTNSVKISGEVFRFSEKIIDVPVEVINLPEGTTIKTFPNTIAILCKARIDRLKNLNSSDFKIVADYNLAKSNARNLKIRLVKKPVDVSSAQVLETQVEFILKRE